MKALLFLIFSVFFTHLVLSNIEIIPTYLKYYSLGKEEFCINVRDSDYSFLIKNNYNYPITILIQEPIQNISAKPKVITIPSQSFQKVSICAKNLNPGIYSILIIDITNSKYYIFSFEIMEKQDVIFDIFEKIQKINIFGFKNEGILIFFLILFISVIFFYLILKNIFFSVLISIFITFLVIYFL